MYVANCPMCAQSTYGIMIPKKLSTIFAIFFFFFLDLSNLINVLFKFCLVPIHTTKKVYLLDNTNG